MIIRIAAGVGVLSASSVVIGRQESDSETASTTQQTVEAAGEAARTIAQAASELTVGDVLAFVVVGALAGAIVGRIFSGKMKGYGAGLNMLIGLIGAAIGGVLFAQLGLDFDLGSFDVTYSSLLAALVGAVLLLAPIVLYTQHREAKKKAAEQKKLDKQAQKIADKKMGN
ncbi:MAG: GlsB/YeaQ/YmgE family stress response membrane protein [Phycisphaerales bacterium]